MMEIKDFIKNFTEQFDETEFEIITAETEFHKLEDYSSLVALSVIAMIDEIYGVIIGANEMKSSVTVCDLFNKVVAKLNNGK